ncbi:hypothetical protein ACWWD9_00545 [Methylovorus sp. SPW-M1]|jgi:hypothetical protein
MLSAEEANLLAKTKSEGILKWRPLFLQIEASALMGGHSLDCMDMALPEEYTREELREMLIPLGYSWTDGSFESFYISW